MTQKKYNIGITLPYLFSVRDFVYSEVWDEMVKCEEANFFLFTSKEITKPNNTSHIKFVKFPPATPNKGIFKKVIHKIQNRLRSFDLKYLHPSLMQRFAAINRLSHYKIREERSPEVKAIYQVLSDYRYGEEIAYPFPKSKLLFTLLYHLKYLLFTPVIKEHLNFIAGYNLDLFVFNYVHINYVPYWSKIMKKLQIPSIGVVSSWDHPTTKGPLPKGIEKFIVASKRMEEELIGLNKIDKQLIHQVGKVQMDIYLNNKVIEPRETFLQKFNIPPHHKIVTFGTNATGLKEHEVSIAKYLAESFQKGNFKNCTLILRAHPQDKHWLRDFKSLEDAPHVICFKGSSFKSEEEKDTKDAINQDRMMLANLMKHSDIVLQSRGSLALDAIAFNTPVISIAFDGDLPRNHIDSFAHEYNFEHFKPLLLTNGTYIVSNYQQLTSAIQTYLNDPTIHQSGREQILKEQIAPLDGKTSQRLVHLIVSQAKELQDKQPLSLKSWKYNGIGNQTWAPAQKGDIFDFIDKRE